MPAGYEIPARRRGSRQLAIDLPGCDPSAKAIATGRARAGRMGVAMVRILRRVFLVLMLSAGIAAAAQGRETAAADTAGTVLITGSDRGIGFELAKQYALRNWKVLATCRTPAHAQALAGLAASHPNVVIEELDVTDVGEIEALAAKYAGTSIDVLINNAGIFGDVASQSLEELDYDDFVRVMAVNAFGPLKVSQAFIDHVAASRQKKIVTITSGLASMTLTDNVRQGFYFYRASKASVNIISRALAAELRGRKILVGLFNPGVVDTGFGATGYAGPRLSPEQAATALVAFIETLNPDNAATMINHDGTAMPW